MTISLINSALPYSVAAAVICFVVYHLWASDRIRIAKARGTKPQLSGLRAVFIAVTLIIQFWIWAFVHIASDIAVHRR